MRVKGDLMSKETILEEEEGEMVQVSENDARTTEKGCDAGFMLTEEAPEEEDYSEFFPDSEEDGMDEQVYVEADTSTYEDF